MILMKSLFIVICAAILILAGLNLPETSFFYQYLRLFCLLSGGVLGCVGLSYYITFNKRFRCQKN